MSYVKPSVTSAPNPIRPLNRSSGLIPLSNSNENSERTYDSLAKDAGSHCAPSRSFNGARDRWRDMGGIQLAVGQANLRLSLCIIQIWRACRSEDARTLINLRASASSPLFDVEHEGLRWRDVYAITDSSLGERSPIATATNLRSKGVQEA
jgi:hypothetical protein